MIYFGSQCPSSTLKTIRQATLHARAHVRPDSLGKLETAGILSHQAGLLRGYLGGCLSFTFSSAYTRCYLILHHIYSTLSLRQFIMISLSVSKILDHEKVYSVLLAEFVLYGLALALQGFSVRTLGLFVATGWIWISRPRLPKGTRMLPGPWGKLHCPFPILSLNMSMQVFP